MHKQVRENKLQQSVKQPWKYSLCQPRAVVGTRPFPLPNSSLYSAPTQERYLLALNTPPPPHALEDAYTSSILLDCFRSFPKVFNNIFYGLFSCSCLTLTNWWSQRLIGGPPEMRMQGITMAKQVGETWSTFVCKPDPILLALSQSSLSYPHFWQDFSTKIWCQQRW